jgi:hypothetical protein
MRYFRLTFSIPGWSAGFGFLVAVTLPAWGDPAMEAAPAPYPSSRYETLRTNSPFSLATPEVAAVPQASFAANWFVSGIARIGDADFVTIKSRDLSMQFSIFGDETDGKTGVGIASVNWSEAVGKSSVILRKGTETATLEFNESEVRAAPAPLAAGSIPVKMNPVPPLAEAAAAVKAAEEHRMPLPPGSVAAARRRAAAIQARQ